MSIRLEEKPLEYNGKTYLLRCNMAVLDRLQDSHDGDFSAVMRLPATKGMIVILCAMMNDYAEDMGWEEVTEKELKKNFSYAYLVELGILEMFTKAIIPHTAEEQGN